jgi:prepilin-type N-terminal cleavage/methylation domain-containing protein
MPRLKAYSDNSAFTLLELLVSSAIIGLMMMVLLTAASTSLGVWRGAENRISVDREGRNGMALIADDLANMVALSAPASLQAFYSGSATNNSWNNGVFMEFPVLRPADYQEQGGANSGDVCYVRYRYDTGKKQILRSHVDSKVAFDSIKTGSAPPASGYEILAENVVEISVNTYGTNGASTSAQASISSVNLSIGVVDRQERENLTTNPPITLPDSKTSKQFFSVNFAVPRPL